MTGGITAEAETSVEQVDLAGVSKGPPLPWKFSHHCFVYMGWSDTWFNFRVMLIGGKHYPDRTCIGADKSNPRPFWSPTSGPKLWQNGGRMAHSCVHIKHNNGSNYVIAAGGYSDYEEILSTSEILNTDDCDLDDCSSDWYPGEDFFCRTLV